MKKKKNITTIIQRVSDHYIAPLIPKKIKDSIKPSEDKKDDSSVSEDKKGRLSER